MMEKEDFKTEAFQNQIKILKSNKELTGTVTRNEIRDLERSIRLIKWGKQKRNDEELEWLGNILVVDFSNMDKFEIKNLIKLRHINKLK